MDGDEPIDPGDRRHCSAQIAREIDLEGILIGDFVYADVGTALQKHITGERRRSGTYTRHCGPGREILTRHGAVAEGSARYGSRPELRFGNPLVRNKKLKIALPSSPAESSSSRHRGNVSGGRADPGEPIPVKPKHLSRCGGPVGVQLFVAHGSIGQDLLRDGILRELSGRNAVLGNAKRDRAGRAGRLQARPRRECRYDRARGQLVARNRSIGNLAGRDGLVRQLRRLDPAVGEQIGTNAARLYVDGRGQAVRVRNLERPVGILDSRDAGPVRLRRREDNRSRSLVYVHRGPACGRKLELTPQRVDAGHGCPRRHRVGHVGSARPLGPKRVGCAGNPQARHSLPIDLNLQVAVRCVEEIGRKRLNAPEQ